MNRHLAAFAKPYASGSVPFLIIEPVTSGDGTMVDLLCRFANAPALRLLNLAEEAGTFRFSHYLSPAELAAFAPLCTVAFSGSAAAVEYTTIQGEHISFIAHQLLYGTVGCVLNLHAETSAPSASLPTAQEGCQAVIDLQPGVIRCLSFTNALEDLTDWTHRELYHRCGEDFTALALPEDRSALLQCLRDAGRSRTGAVMELRLARRDGSPRYVRLELQPWAGNPRQNIFLVRLTDIHAYRQEIDRLRAEIAGR